jgi:hypothetical protein
MTITPVTPDKFASLKTQLASNAEVTGDAAGTISGHGVIANYTYDAPSQTLTVDVIHHPFYIPVSAIESQLRDAVAAA